MRGILTPIWPSLLLSRERERSYSYNHTKGPLLQERAFHHVRFLLAASFPIITGPSLTTSTSKIITSA